MTKKNTAATVATIIVAVLAIAAVLFLLYNMSNKQIDDLTASGYVPTEAESSEMSENASRLVQADCEIFRLFLLYGLPYMEEPYGNIPEDGVYEAKSDTYKTVQDIEKLVKDTFTEKEATRILTNVSGDNVAVFKDKKGKLGIDQSRIKDGRFVSIDYKYSWTNAKLTLEPVSSVECKLLIELEPLKEETSASSKLLTANMSKSNGKWYLRELVY